MCTAMHASKAVSPLSLSDPGLAELQEVLRTGQGRRYPRARPVAMEELLDAEATAVIGAGRYERTDSRVTERIRLRFRLLTTGRRRHRPGGAQCAPGRRVGRFFRLRPWRPQAIPKADVERLDSWLARM